MKIRKYCEKDIPEMVHIWNEVVKEGNAFPQEDYLDEVSGKEFFKSQSYCGVAVEGDSLDVYIADLDLYKSELYQKDSA